MFLRNPSIWFSLLVVLSVAVWLGFHTQRHVSINYHNLDLSKTCYSLVYSLNGVDDIQQISDCDTVSLFNFPGMGGFASEIYKSHAPMYFRIINDQGQIVAQENTYINLLWYKCLTIKYDPGAFQEIKIEKSIVPPNFRTTV